MMQAPTARKGRANNMLQPRDITGEDPEPVLIYALLK